MYKIYLLATSELVATFESHAEAWAALIVRTDCYMVQS